MAGRVHFDPYNSLSQDPWHSGVLGLGLGVKLFSPAQAPGAIYGPHCNDDGDDRAWQEYLLNSSNFPAQPPLRRSVLAWGALMENTERGHPSHYHDS